MMSISGQYSWRREPMGRPRGGGGGGGGVGGPAPVGPDGAAQETTNSQYGQWFNSEGHAPEIYWNGTLTRVSPGPPGGVTSAARNRVGGRPSNDGSAPSSPAKITWQQQQSATAVNGGDVQRRNESTIPEVQARTSWRHISPQQSMQRSATTLGLPATGSSKTDDSLNHSDLLRDYARYRQLQSGIGLLGTTSTSVSGSVPEVHIDGTWRGRVVSRGPNSTSAGNGDMVVAQSAPAIFSPMSSNRLLSRQNAFGGANSTSGSNTTSTSVSTSDQLPVGSRPGAGLPATGSGAESTLIIPLRLGEKTTSGSDVNGQLRQAISYGAMEEASPTFSWNRPQTGYGNALGSRVSSFPLMIGSLPIGDGSENTDIGGGGQSQTRTAFQLQGSDTGSRLSYSAPSSDQFGPSSAGSDAYRMTSTTSTAAGGGATCQRSVPDTNARPKRSILKKSSSYSSVQSANGGGGEQPPWRIGGGGGGGGVRWPPVSGYIRDPYNCGGALYRQRTAPSGFNERAAPAPAFEPARPTTTSSSKRVTFSV